MSPASPLPPSVDPEGYAATVNASVADLTTRL